MSDKICQSCGMPLTDVGFFGTNKDETLNDEYCIYCYAFGEFNEDMTMEEMIEVNLEFAGISEGDEEPQAKVNEAREKMLELYPTLKRWKRG